jgi:hypothetical protein
MPGRSAYPELLERLSKGRVPRWRSAIAGKYSCAGSGRAGSRDVAALEWRHFCLPPLTDLPRAAGNSPQSEKRPSYDAGNFSHRRRRAAKTTGPGEFPGISGRIASYHRNRSISRADSKVVPPCFYGFCFLGGSAKGRFLGLASSLQTVTMSSFQCGVACSRLDEHLTMLRMARIVEHACTQS